MDDCVDSPAALDDVAEAAKAALESGTQRFHLSGELRRGPVCFFTCRPMAGPGGGSASGQSAGATGAVEGGHGRKESDIVEKRSKGTARARTDKLNHRTGRSGEGEDKEEKKTRKGAGHKKKPQRPL